VQDILPCQLKRENSKLSRYKWGSRKERKGPKNKEIVASKKPDFAQLRSWVQISVNLILSRPSKVPSKFEFKMHP